MRIAHNRVLEPSSLLSLYMKTDLPGSEWTGRGESLYGGNEALGGAGAEQVLTTINLGYRYILLEMYPVGVRSSRTVMGCGVNGDLGYNWEPCALSPGDGTWMTVWQGAETGPQLAALPAMVTSTVQISTQPGMSLPWGGLPGGVLCATHFFQQFLFCHS